MNYNEVRELVKKLANENYSDFVKSLIGLDYNIEDEDLLDEIYDFYMKSDIDLLNEGFEYIIDEVIENED